MGFAWTVDGNSKARSLVDVASYCIRRVHSSGAGFDAS
jgi:hypothetical protein